MSTEQTKRTNPVLTGVVAILLAAGGVLGYQAVTDEPEQVAYPACAGIYTYPLGPYGPRVYVGPWHPPLKCVRV